MNARNPPEQGWFEGLDTDDTGDTQIRHGSAAGAADWPQRAVETETVATEQEYYDWLHQATIAAARAEATEREQADDKQLVHAVRALDDCERTANELLERVAEWAGTHDEAASVDIEYASELADTEPTGPVERRMGSLATRVEELREEADSLRGFIERSGAEAAPNLTALAGPVLAARLIALAGDLETLAKKPAGTVQVLGAEDALFAHLRGGAPSPKHGIIYTHDAVNNTAPPERGSAARALAGKLTIAARIDYYSGEYRPELEAELADRMERIHARDSA